MKNPPNHLTRIPTTTPHRNPTLNGCGNRGLQAECAEIGPARVGVNLENLPTGGQARKDSAPKGPNSKLSLRMTVFWADGGCRFQDSSGRRRECYGSYSDGASVQRFNFPTANTSNEAEYRTLIELLSTLKVGAVPTIRIDSKLVVGQLTRGWRVRAENLKPLHRQAKEFLRSRKARLVWVPRKQIVARLGH